MSNNNLGVYPWTHAGVTHRSNNSTWQ